MRIQSKCMEHHCKKYFQLNCAGYWERENKYCQIQKKTTFKFKQASQTYFLKDLLTFWISQRHNMFIATFLFGKWWWKKWNPGSTDSVAVENIFPTEFKIVIKYMSGFCKKSKWIITTFHFLIDNSKHVPNMCVDQMVTLINDGLVNHQYTVERPSVV